MAGFFQLCLACQEQPRLQFSLLTQEAEAIAPGQSMHTQVTKQKTQPDTDLSCKLLVH